MPAKSGAILIVAMLLSGAARAADTCQPLTRATHVTLTATKGGLPLVPVTVNGHPEEFILSTAVALSAVSDNLAVRLNIPRHHGTIRFVNLDGRESSTLGMVENFSLGRLHAQDVEFHVQPPPPDGRQVSPDAPAGTLGADFLRAYDIDIDFGTNEMNLFERNHCAGKVVYWNPATLAVLPMTVRDDGKITFPMTLDGHVLQTVLSTGNRATVLNMRVAAEVFGLDSNSAGMEQTGRLNAQTPLYAHKFKALTADGLTVANPRIVLMPNLADEKIRHPFGMRGRLLLPASAQQPDLTLGMAELRHLHIYIDYHDQTLYLSAAGNPATAPSPVAVAAPR